MKVNGLVTLQKQFQNAEFSLKENCGDGYLCAHNKIYRNIRKTALNFGVKYKVGGTTRWLDYVVFPLMSFQNMLDKNEIPYIDNFNVLRRIARNYPGITLPEKFIRDSFKRNYVLHESCHCITHKYFEDKKNSGGAHFSKNISPELSKTINSLLSEAFANSIERASSSLADSSTHIFLHVLNSYVEYEPKNHELMVKVRENIGERLFFTMIFASFFFNNLLKYTHTVETVQNIIEKFDSSELSKKKKNKELTAEALYRCCRLNPRFRDETSVVYFSSLGLDKEYESLTYENVIEDEIFCGHIRRSAEELYDLIFDITPQPISA